MFQGSYYRLDGLARTIAPASFPHPPLWIGGRGGSLCLAAELDAAWLSPAVMSLTGLHWRGHVASWATRSNVVIPFPNTQSSASHS